MPGAGVPVLALRGSRRAAKARQSVHREGAAIAGRIYQLSSPINRMGIDIYAEWHGMSDAEKKAQVTGFSVEHGHVGYLREAYHGEPYATHVLLAESFETGRAAIKKAGIPSGPTLLTESKPDARGPHKVAKIIRVFQRGRTDKRPLV